MGELGIRRVTGGERDWTIGGWRVGRFTGFMYGDNGSRFPA